MKGINLAQLKAMAKESGVVLELSEGNKGERAERTYPENDFQERVIYLAHLYGWKVAHFRPARTQEGWRTAVAADGKGFLDLVMVRERLVVAELKYGNNDLSDDQRNWFDWFKRAQVETYTWWPEDWDEIEKVLEPVDGR